MSKKIKIPYGGKTYVLEFTRQTASTIEKNGFVVTEISDKPATMIPLLYRGAFLANHPNTKGETIEKIIASLKNKTGLIQALVEMFSDAVSTLFDTEEGDEGNPGWEAVE